jgi:hypothetical protein
LVEGLHCAIQPVEMQLTLELNQSQDSLFAFILRKFKGVITAIDAFL